MGEMKKFYQMTISERQQVLRTEYGASEADIAAISGEAGLSEDTADRMIENVIGRYAHAIKSGEYMEMKNCTINVTAAVKDGVSCNQYFLMESGELNISGTQDDGIQCDLDGDTSTGQLDDHEDEDSGNIYILGGTINVSVTAAAC